MKEKIEKLPQGRFLLGFSGGVDSSALFFLLLSEGVEFDVAIVDYGVREQSKEEVAYAQRLAKQYGKMCHHRLAPRIEGNFEARAREYRYEFFLSLLLEYGYDGVILAHQLNDRFEWMMMQFCKGAGLNTLLGFEFESEYRGAKIFRPLLRVDKQSLYRYCKEHQILYFEDLSNQEDKYLRNRFREFLQPLMQEYGNGISQSFEYLHKEKHYLYPPKELKKYAEMTFWERGEDWESIHLLDLEFKKRGYLLSSKQKDEIMQRSFSCEIVNFIIESTISKIFVLPKREGSMSKDFRDFARRLQIPKRLRLYLFTLKESEERILEFVSKNEIGIFEQIAKSCKK